MADEGWNEDISEDEEDELVDRDVTSNKDAILFAIDAQAAMQAVPSSQDEERGKAKSSFVMALQAILSLQMRKIVTSPSDLVGVMLYNTAETVQLPDVRTKEHIYVFQPVTQVDVPAVLKLKNLLEAVGEDPTALDELRPCKDAEKVTIVDVMIACNAIIRTAGRTGTKRIFLITGDSDPHPISSPTGESLRKKTRTRVNDLAGLGVGIEPFFVSSPSKPFDYSAFWASVLGDEDEAAADVPKSAFERFEDMEKEMRVRETPKRTAFDIPLWLGESFVIGVKGYGLVAEQKKQHAVYVYRGGRTTKEVFTRTVYECSDTGAVLGKEDIEQGFRFGNTGDLRSVKKFNPEEMRSFKTLGCEPGLKLLGFKDQSELCFEDNVKHSYFIYPSEQDYAGSTRTFAALLHSCSRKNKIGLGLLVPRKSSAPVFVAMLPQEEERDEETGAQLKPPGFHLIQIPFADDLREPVVPKTVTATEEEVSAASRFVSKYTYKQPYNPDQFPNPTLNHHYACLKAVAFHEDLPEEAEDVTVCNGERINKRIGPLLSEFKKVVTDDHRCFAPPPEPPRGATSNKRRPETEWDAGVDRKVRRLHDDGEVNKLTVAELRNALKHYGQDMTGRKAELVQRLSQHLDQMMSSGN